MNEEIIWTVTHRSTETKTFYVKAKSGDEAKRKAVANLDSGNHEDFEYKQKITAHTTGCEDHGADSDDQLSRRLIR